VRFIWHYLALSPSFFAFALLATFRDEGMGYFARRMEWHWLVFKDQWNSVHYDFDGAACLVCVT
jgi:hypothetical protein